MSVLTFWTHSWEGFGTALAAISVLLSRNKSTKSSPLKRRDGSVWRSILESCQILTCQIATNYFYAVVKIRMNSCNQPPAAKPALISLLRRGGLPLTICVRSKLSLRLLSDHEGLYITSLARRPAERRVCLGEVVEVTRKISLLFRRGTKKSRHGSCRMIRSEAEYSTHEWRFFGTFASGQKYGTLNEVV